MGQGAQRGQAEESGRALDAVDRAKHTRQRFAIGRVLLERHQIGLDQLEMLAALDQKFLEDGVKLGHGYLAHAVADKCDALDRAASALTRAARRRGSTGFNM